jgi:ubiquinone/menaquinone biosynthesis C-methylase UbiE
MDSKDHWDEVYDAKGSGGVSWYQQKADLSLRLIQSVSAPGATIIDVGGGASTLVDSLLEAGHSHLTILDWSATALDLTRKRLGLEAVRVNWLEADVLTARLPANAYDIWHDRAVFHFLTTAHDRDRYVAQVRRAVKPGGHVLVATFAEDGPETCSGLPVARYSADELHAEFGHDFRLMRSERQHHLTPWGASQAFTYCLCRYCPKDAAGRMQSAA